jgi:heat-inducible transcriptional repressor
MLDERKAAILRAVVEEYIRTAQPVGSAHVAQLAGLSVSPATVRNEMMALEREGFLVQPHTSAGRVPTDRGYRFFVDNLAGPGPLQPGQAELVRTFFDRAHGEIERMLADTSRLLSGLTDYAAVVVAPSASEPGQVRSAQLVPLTGRLVLVVAVLANGVVLKQPIELPVDIDEVDVSRASALVAAAYVGRPLGAPASPPPSGSALVDQLTGLALRSLVAESRGGDEHQVYVGGAARMAAAFDAIDTVRTVLGILEQQFVLVTLLKDVLDRGLTVAIGAEHGVVPLSDCSVVVAPYIIEGERVGTVGVLGPTRMHYDQALAAVAVVSKQLGRALTEGSGGREESRSG